MSKSRKGKPLKDNRNPIISKNIKTGEKQLFDSTIEASNYYNCHPTSITRVLTGKRYSNNGYKFYYKEKSKRTNSKIIKNNNEESLKYLTKLTKEKVKEIKLLLQKGVTNVEISKVYKVHEVTIGQIKNNKIWKTVNI